MFYQVHSSNQEAVVPTLSHRPSIKSDENQDLLAFVTRHPPDAERAVGVYSVQT